MATNIDPTMIRLSDNIMLSDLMGCTSIYRHGITNRITDSAEDKKKLTEAHHLAETMDAIIQVAGPVSFTYGYISPHLSRQIVTYQDGNKPSYHRWDAGAALDFVIHSSNPNCEPKSPIEIVQGIERADIPYSRMITYAESKVMCLGTRIEERNRVPRKALYENRFIAEQQRPTHIKHPASRSRRLASLAEAVERANLKGWVGQGYPSYHLRGVKQLEHEHTSQYTVLSDFLYHARAVNSGKRHRREFGPAVMRTLRAAGEAVDHVVGVIHRPVSILKALSPYIDDDWDNGEFEFEFVPPRNVPLGDVLGIIANAPNVCMAGIITKRSGAKRILVRGSIDD